MKKITRILNFTINKAAYISGAAILFLMTYTTVNVIMRAMGHPMKGDIEVTTEVEVIVIYFVIAEGLISNTHIKIDLFKKFPVIDHINHVIALAISVFISVQAFHMVGTALRMNMQTLVLGIPKAPFIFVSGLGFALFSLAIISDEIKLLTEVRDRRLSKKKLAEEEVG